MTRIAIPGGGKPTTIDEDELLERKAEMAKDRLLRTVDELDERRHKVEGSLSSLRLIPLAAGAIGGLFVLTAMLDGLRSFARHRRRRRALRRFARALHLR